MDVQLRFSREFRMQVAGQRGIDLDGVQLVGSRQKMPSQRPAPGSDLDDSRRMFAASRNGETFEDGIADEKMLAKLAGQELVGV